MDGKRVVDHLTIDRCTTYITICTCSIFYFQVGETGCAIGIEHIKELNDQAILNIEENNKHLLTSGRVKLVGKEPLVNCNNAILCKHDSLDLEHNKTIVEKMIL